MRQRDGSASVLTRRQAEILVLIADDMPHTEIARHLHITYGTVRHHVAAIRIAMGTRTCAGAVAKAFRLGELS
jgi:DNA-binding CsgD family transcriptional regulator